MATGRSDVILTLRSTAGICRRVLGDGFHTRASPRETLDGWGKGCSRGDVVPQFIDGRSLLFVLFALRSFLFFHFCDSKLSRDREGAASTMQRPEVAPRLVVSPPKRRGAFPRPRSR